MLAAAAGHGADGVLDLSDEPVLSEERRVGLACHALAAGPGLRGRRLRASAAAAAAASSAPAVAVIGTGKRVGKTAVSGAPGPAAAADGPRRGGGGDGPRRPGRAGAGGAVRRPVGVEQLLERSRAGQHAASDFLEDAALAGVATVGARRCGGGLFGRPYLSNVAEAAALAGRSSPDLILLEGSGAAVPPIAADRTVLVHVGHRPAAALTAGFGRYRLLRRRPGGDHDVRARPRRHARGDRGGRAGLPTVAVTLRPAPRGAARRRRGGLLHDRARTEPCRRGTGRAARGRRGGGVPATCPTARALRDDLESRTTSRRRARTWSR